MHVMFRKYYTVTFANNFSRILTNDPVTLFFVIFLSEYREEDLENVDQLVFYILYSIEA